MRKKLSFTPYLLAVLAFAGLGLYAWAANPTAFTLTDTVRVSGVASDALYDPVFAHSWKIESPSGTGSSTFKVDTEDIRVPFGCETATLNIQRSNTNVTWQTAGKIQDPTGHLYVIVAGRNGISGVTPLLIAPSTPSSATRYIKDEGSYIFPVQAGGEIIVSVSAHKEAVAFSTSEVKRFIHLDLNFNKDE